MAKIKAKKTQRKQKGSSTKFLVVIALVVLAGIAYAVNSGDSSGQGASGDVMTLAEARIAIDEEYVTKGLSPTDTGPVMDDYTPILMPRLDDNLILPPYAIDALAMKAYTFATEHPEVLEQIPCYCGCGGEHTGHRFLRDCFIHDDGTYDNHASFCDICIGETLKAQKYLGMN